MKVKVDVPATASRKAYSYFRNANAVKKGAAGVGAALALGGLAAIALRKTPEESKAIPAPVPTPAPTQPTSGISSPPSSKDILKAYGVKIGVKSAQLGAALAVRKGIGVAAEKIVSEMRKKERDNRYNNLQDEVRKRAEEIKKKKQEDIDADLASRTIDVKATSIDNILEAPKTQPPVSDRLPSPNGVLPSTKPKFEIPRTLIPPVRSQSSPSSALTVTPSESPKNTGNAIAEPQKSRLTQIAGSAGAALGRIYRKGVNTYNASIERDRVAREKLASRTVDLNEVSRKVGSGARSVLNAVDGLAQRVKKSIAKEPPAIDVKAEEIKEPEPPRKMRGITIRALPQGGKRRRGRPKLKFTPKDFVNPEDKQVRNNSVYMRIDSFVEQLREDAKCGSGTKPCGKICIPQDKNCIGETAKAFGGGALQSLAGPIGSGTYRALRSQGRGRGTSIAGAIGANIAATAGTIALGNMAYNKALKDQEEALRNPVKKGVEMGKTITKMADKDFEKAKKKGK